MTALAPVTLEGQVADYVTAIALNSRSAFLATAYSAVPAVIVAYAFYFLASDFL